MNTYIREVGKMLETLGLVRRSGSPWISGFVTGAGLGVVAGAVTAALLTPSNGAEMRKLVSKRAKRLAISAERTMSEHPRHNGTREHHA